MPRPEHRLLGCHARNITAHAIWTCRQVSAFLSVVSPTRFVRPEPLLALLLLRDGELLAPPGPEFPPTALHVHL